MLEAFRSSGVGNCATVERLSKYLRHRVPELCRRYDKAPSQTPNTSVDPLEKYHYILLPQHATSADIATLRNDAYRLAFIDDQPLLAQQICIRAIATPMGHDMELLELFVQIQRLPNSSVNISIQTSEGARSPAASPVTRQQFLKWFFWGGTGVALATGTGFLISVTSDYSQLENFLKTQQWKEADRETLDVMLKVAGRKQEGWLDVNDLQNFDCEVLKAIDQLWVKHSNGKFGFSVQTKIWKEVGSPTEQDAQWDEFGDRVGWRKNGFWQNYSSLRYSSISSPDGIFPVLVLYTAMAAVGGLFAWSGLNEFGLVWPSFFSRTETCAV